MTTLVSLKNIAFDIEGRSILKNISFDIQQGEIITLIGPNGAGKTTLIKIILGLQKPSSGERSLRKKLTIGYMPQKLHIDNSMPLTVKRFLSLAGDKLLDIQSALARTGVTHVINSPVQTISGGEMQRVLLARALLSRPDLLVLDEPVQGVDITGQRELYNLITQIRDEDHCSVLMVSHDLHLVMASTDSVICINKHICCSGHPQVVKKHPAYLNLFGLEATEMAIYTHQHDHKHDIHGDIISEHQANVNTGPKNA
ncbi:MAG: zinc ABC transporter ATP-binding protein ZnuC [Endozoicomonas sp. (ex Botrylloides leachii)]|nr:zinc ABC transporter ATP-binding protein ZnuC [Endozoicomonas sp. (ex Botrylloides leachii)]